MTYREYIDKILEVLKGESVITCDPKTVLPYPDEDDKGMLAAFLAASNPHFIAARKQNPFWYLRAQQELEKLAKKVGSMLNPDADAVEGEVLRFLEDFLARNLEMKGLKEEKEIEDKKDEEDEEEEEEDGQEEEQEESSNGDEQESTQMHGDGYSKGPGIAFEAGEGEDMGEAASIDELLDQLFSKSEEEKEKKSENSEGGETEEDNEEEEEKGGDANDGSSSENDSESLEDSHSDDEDSSDSSSDAIGSGTSKSEERRRENRFLRKIPKGLFELAKLIGRSGSAGFKPSGSFPSASKCDITGITIGDNLNSILPSETALLSCPATQTVFFRNFVEKRLQIFASASSGQVPIEHQDGPVVICLDTSGSMNGEKIDVACNLTIAITIIAQRRHRDVLVIKYSDWHYLYKVTNMARDKGGLMKFLQFYSGMGNSENELFRWLFEDVLPKEPAFDSADILCVTDFGWEGLYGETQDRIERAKKKGVTFYGLNICDGSEPEGFRDYCDEMMSSVCDSLWTYHNGNCYEIPIPKATEKKSKQRKPLKEKKDGSKPRTPKRKKIGYL